MDRNYIPAPPSPQPINVPSSNTSALKIVLAVFGAMIAAVLGLIVLLLIGVEAGPVGLIVGMICACLPVPVYVMLLLWIDRYESEPIWMLITAFLWGAVVAVFVAYVLNTIFAVVSAVSTHSMQVGETMGAVISAPIVEESAKATILFAFFFFKKDEFDGIIDGIVYAGMVGLGFAMTENIMYYGRALVGGGVDALTFVFILRGMVAPFSHPLFTSMTGIGLGWSRQSDNGFVKVTMPVLGLMFAMMLHGAWNLSATLGGIWFIVAYLMIMAPAFVITLMTIFFSLRREGRIVREFLYPDYQSGLFPLQEYEKLCSVRGRMGMSWQVFWNRGFSVWRVRMRRNQIASELAFHRSRVARGFVGSSQAAQERERVYQQMLQDLRRKLAT